MTRVLALLTLLAALLGAAPWLLPVAKESVRLVTAPGDPVTLADLSLRGFTAADAQAAIAAALDRDDAALAASTLELADARGLAVPDALRARVAQATSSTAEALRAARRFGAGFVTGQPEDLAGLAGTAVSDLMVWGDLRDASREGLKLAWGEDADELILGLSTLGLALTAGTYATGGAGLSVRAGVSLVKGAARAGHLSVALARSLTRALRESLDLAALRRLAQHPASLDGAALKGVVRSERLGALTAMLDDVARIQAKAGTRAALEGLRVADSGEDLARLARLSEAKGGQTLAIVKILGRGALTLTGALLTLVWWALALCAYAYLVISTVNGFCVACARRLWRRRGDRKRSGREDGQPAGRAMPRRRAWLWSRGVGSGVAWS